jgi:hypothetical protein
MKIARWFLLGTTLATWLLLAQTSEAQAPRRIRPLARPAIGSGQNQTQDTADAANHAPDMPGPIHEEMAKVAGDYTTETKFWMKPGDKPQESKGTARITSILDGRFLSEDNTGSMMGKPIKGHRLIGYNQGAKQFESVWTYTMSTGIMTMTGTSKDQGRTVHWNASYSGPEGKKQTLEVETRHLDEDHFVVKLMHATGPGGEGPVMETTYSRKK